MDETILRVKILPNLNASDSFEGKSQGKVNKWQISFQKETKNSSKSIFSFIFNILMLNTYIIESADS